MPTGPKATTDLALQIRKLPSGHMKVLLAEELANLSTEGDFGHDTLQAVATTLAQALHETPVRAKQGDPPEAYLDAYTELAELARYEHVDVSLQDPAYSLAVSKVASVAKARAKADFTLQDLEGKSWTLSSLRGKVVWVNFWATWCPPCRKEMPDLEALFQEFKDAGLVVLAISDEDIAKVKPFIVDKQYTFPVLLDPGRKTNNLFSVGGIPKSFVYNRRGELVAQAIDMRTRKQMLAMLAKAGLKE